MSYTFDDRDYNPRYGLRGTGKVREKDFSIDGRSWEFRNPQNEDAKRRQRSNWTGRGRDPGLVNKNAYEKANELYDYDYGTVRDAAKALGIGNVDEKKEVRQILKYIREGRSNKEETSSETQQQDPGPLLPRGERVPRFNKPLAEIPGMTRPGLADANMAAIRGGDDLNEWYQTKFVPHLEADANATNSEIGDDSRYFLSKFAFEPPKLGDVKEIYDIYKDEIEDLD